MPIAKLDKFWDIYRMCYLVKPSKHQRSRYETITPQFNRRQLSSSFYFEVLILTFCVWQVTWLHLCKVVARSTDRGDERLILDLLRPPWLIYTLFMELSENVIGNNHSLCGTCFDCSIFTHSLIGFICHFSLSFNIFYNNCMYELLFAIFVLIIQLIELFIVYNDIDLRACMKWAAC